MAQALEEANVGLNETFKDLFSGAVGGIAQVLIGQPFDIIKVRLQTTSDYKGAADCATQILKKEGPSAFYKGTLTPLIGIGACVSVQFGAYNYARRAFEWQTPSSPPRSSTSASACRRNPTAPDACTLAHWTAFPS